MGPFGAVRRPRRGSDGRWREHFRCAYLGNTPHRSLAIQHHHEYVGRDVQLGVYASFSFYTILILLRS